MKLFRAVMEQLERLDEMVKANSGGQFSGRFLFASKEEILDALMYALIFARRRDRGR